MSALDAQPQQTLAAPTCSRTPGAATLADKLHSVNLLEKMVTELIEALETITEAHALIKHCPSSFEARKAPSPTRSAPYSTSASRASRNISSTA